TSDRNAHGVPGTDYSAGSGSTGPRSGTASGHGGMSPWTVRNTFFAWGTDVKRSATIRVPAGNADLTPTLLALVGVKPAGLGRPGAPRGTRRRSGTGTGAGGNSHLLGGSGRR